MPAAIQMPRWEQCDLVLSETPNGSMEAAVVLTRCRAGEVLQAQDVLGAHEMETATKLVTAM